MHRLIAFLLLFMCASVSAQEQKNEFPLQKLSVNDTLKENIKKLNSFKLGFYTFRQKYFNNELNFAEPSLPYSTWMLRSGFTYNNAAPLMQKSDMMRSYKMLYGTDDNMKFLYTVLGMAETATVGVMAYKHIKKYGFFSK